MKFEWVLSGLLALLVAGTGTMYSSLANGIENLQTTVSNRIDRLYQRVESLESGQKIDEGRISDITAQNKILIDTMKSYSEKYNEIAYNNGRRDAHITHLREQLMEITHGTPN